MDEDAQSSPHSQVPVAATPLDDLAESQNLPRNFHSSEREPFAQYEVQSEESVFVGDAIIVDSPGPWVVGIDTPEGPCLAWCQSAYLKLLGDSGRVLAGFYDPFTYQFAYGNAGQQPYRLGWYSYNDFVLLPNSSTSIGGKFQDMEW